MKPLDESFYQPIYITWSTYELRLEIKFLTKWLLDKSSPAYVSEWRIRKQTIEIILNKRDE